MVRCRWHCENAEFTDASSGKIKVRIPAGVATGTERVLRGGAWNGGDASWVRPTYRFKSPPGLRSHGVGFRCAKDAP